MKPTQNQVIMKENRLLQEESINTIPLLRPHHGLCIHYYEGKGYSQEFISKMDLFMTMIQQTPNMRIRLHTDTDTLCSACPNNKNTCCITYDKVNQYDQMVLTLCHYENNQILSIKEFMNCVKKVIIDDNLLEKVCSDCQWYSICSNKFI